MGGYFPKEELDLIDLFAAQQQAKNPLSPAVRTQALRKLYLLGLDRVGLLPPEMQNLLSDIEREGQP